MKIYSELATRLGRSSSLEAATIRFVSNSFEIGPVQVGGGRLFLIAGPCVIESETHARSMAEAIQRIAAELGVPFIFKASYRSEERRVGKECRSRWSPYH